MKEICVPTECVNQYFNILVGHHNGRNSFLNRLYARSICSLFRLKKVDGNYTRMLRTIMNKSWRQHLTRHQLYGHMPPITKTIQVKRTRHAGHSWSNRDELISDVLLWTPHMAGQKQDDQLEHKFSSYVRIRDVALKTCQRWWTIGRSSEKGSGISVQAVRHDADDDGSKFLGEIYNL